MSSSNHQVEGWLDGISNFLARGWAWDASRYGERLTVDILVDDVVVASGAADILRTDLKQANIGDGLHAFEIQWDCPFQDGLLHHVSARVRDAETTLIGSGKRYVSGALKNIFVPLDTPIGDHAADKQWHEARSPDSSPSDVAALPTGQIAETSARQLKSRATQELTSFCAKSSDGPTLGILALGARTTSGFRPVFEAEIHSEDRLLNRKLYMTLSLRTSLVRLPIRIFAEAAYKTVLVKSPPEQLPYEETPEATAAVDVAVDFAISLKRIEIQSEIHRGWTSLQLELTALVDESVSGAPHHLRFCVETEALPSGSMVELGSAILGDAVVADDLSRSVMAAEPVALPIVPLVPEQDAGYMERSLVLAPILSRKADGHVDLDKAWSLLAGRGGALKAQFEMVSIESDVSAGLMQPQLASRLKIEKNAHYARLVYRVDPAACLAAKDLMIEFQARCVSGAVALQIYLMFEGKDLPYQQKNVSQVALSVGGRANLRSEWLALDRPVQIDKETALAAAKAKKCELVLQIVGTGTLDFYGMWLGNLPEATPGLVKPWDFRKGFDYDRFKATAEPTSLAEDAQPCGVVVFCSASNATQIPALADQLTQTLRRARKSVARTLVVVEDVDFSVPSFKAELQKRMSRSQVSVIDVALVEKFSDAAHQASVRELVEKLPPQAYMLFIETGDKLKSDFAAILARESADIVVFDHDYLSASGTRIQPCLKPGLSPHLLMETDYIAGAAAMRAGWLSEQAELPLLAQIFRGEILRGLLGHSATRVSKIDAILLHRAQKLNIDIESDVAFARSMVQEMNRTAVVLDRGNRISVRYRASGQPLVSLIILFRDKVQFLTDLLSSIFANSTYENYEILLINNRSEEIETLDYLDLIRSDERVRIIEFDEAFNYSRMNNVGASLANGEFLIFMNNDMRVVTPDWIETFIGYADLADSGCVGAKLHYANGRIQHAGVVVGLNGLAGHALEGQHDIACPPELAFHSRDVSAVTGASLCIKRSTFDKVGHFNEEFIVTGNDVEFCLRAMKLGFRNILLGDIQLFHYEKTTRRTIGVKGYDIALSLESYEPYLTEGDAYWNSLASLRRADGGPRRFGEPNGAVRKADARAERTSAIMNRKTGPDVGFIAANNLRLSTIDRVIKANAAYLARKDKKVNSLSLLLPMVDHIYRGGVFTAIRFAAAAYRDLGAVPNIVICAERLPDLESVRRQLLEAFPDVPFNVLSFNPERSNRAVLPRTDVAIATLWTTAYILADYPCDGRFYLVQDYEPLFLAEHAGYGLIETTYQMGLFPICNSQGVAEAIKPYAEVPTLMFNPAVDRDVFTPSTKPKQNNTPVRIVFYGRPTNRRNIFGMGIQALLEVKQRFGDAVDIVSVGAEFDPAEYGASDAITNAGLLPSLESVAALYRSSDIGVVFMQSKHPSYQPLEYMASGCLTVTNSNYSNKWLLRDRENCMLTPVTLDAISETICEAVTNIEMRSKMVKAGLDTVSKLEWNSVERRVTAFLANPSQYSNV